MARAEPARSVVEGMHCSLSHGEPKEHQSRRQRCKKHSPTMAGLQE